MNVQALREVQKRILNEDAIFHMGVWTCCIAGHACRVELGLSELDQLPGPVFGDLPIKARAEKFLGLTEELSRLLFGGFWPPRAMTEDGSRRQAVVAVDCLIEDVWSFLQKKDPRQNLQSESPARQAETEEELVAA